MFRGRKLQFALCLLVLATAPQISAAAETRAPDGVFQLPYVCDTNSTLVRLHELFKKMKEVGDYRHFKDEQQEFTDLLNARNCIQVERGTMFQTVRRTNGAMQIELYSIYVNRQPPRQSLGLYWGATEELSRYMFEKK